MFKIITSELTQDQIIYCEEHNHYIPLDPNNTEYQNVLDTISEEGAACFDGDIPEFLQEAADTKLFQKQLAEYQKAAARLAQYPLEEGREEVREMQPTGEQVFNEETLEMEDVLVEVIVQSAIEPLDLTVEVSVFNEETMETSVETVDNPLIVKDREERAAAQEVIDSTPQSVKDFS